MSSVIYVGMDVHQDSFSLCALDALNGEIIRETKCTADIQNVVKFTSHLPQTDGTQIVLGYEAGIWGYSLYNRLVGLGFECVILAPSTMYSNAKHQMVKNDHQDAQMIAHNLAAGTYRAVYVPDQEDDNVKEFIRLIKSLKKVIMSLVILIKMSIKIQRFMDLIWLVLVKLVIYIVIK